jgi:hypothetical protein
MMRVSQFILPAAVVAFNPTADSRRADEVEVIDDEHDHQSDVTESHQGETPEPITVICEGGYDVEDEFDAEDYLKYRLKPFTKTALDELVTFLNDNEGKNYDSDAMWASWLADQHVEKRFCQSGVFASADGVYAESAVTVTPGEYTKEALRVEIDRQNAIEAESVFDHYTSVEAATSAVRDEVWESAPYYFDEHEYVLLPNTVTTVDPADADKMVIGWLKTRDPVVCGNFTFAILKN